jgi:hypothetical protein
MTPASESMRGDGSTHDPGRQANNGSDIRNRMWNSQWGNKIPGYFHTYSSGVGTWMPAGTYTKMEAFAMAINHYCPWYTASYQPGYDTGSITVTSSMCTARDLFEVDSVAQDYHTASWQWPATLFNPIGMFPGWNYGSISGSNAWWYTQSVIDKSIGYINNIHTVKVAQLHRARHHDYEHKWPTSRKEYNYHDWFYVHPTINSQRNILHFHRTGSATSSFGQYIGHQSIGAFAGTISGSTSSDATSPQAHDYNHDVSRMGGWNHKGWTTKIYTSSMPVSKGYMTQSYTYENTAEVMASLAGGYNTFADNNNLLSGSWGNKQNIKTTYYDWNHYEKVLWKGVEIAPERTFFIDEYMRNPLSSGSSIDSIRASINKPRFSGFETREYSTYGPGNWMLGFASKSTLDLTKFPTEDFTKYKNPNFYQWKYEQRLADLKINNFGSLNLTYSDYYDNCIQCKEKTTTAILDNFSADWQNLHLGRTLRKDLVATLLVLVQEIDIVEIHRQTNRRLHHIDFYTLGLEALLTEIIGGQYKILLQFNYIVETK